MSITSVLTPPAVSALGAAFDVLPTAAALDGKVATMSPLLLSAKYLVSGGQAVARLYCWDADLARWCPAAAAAVTLDSAVDITGELRFNTGGIAGIYTLVKVSGAGSFTYVFREGQS